MQTEETISKMKSLIILQEKQILRGQAQRKKLLDDLSENAKSNTELAESNLALVEKLANLSSLSFLGRISFVINPKSI